MTVSAWSSNPAAASGSFSTTGSAVRSVTTEPLEEGALVVPELRPAGVSFERLFVGLQCLLEEIYFL